MKALLYCPKGKVGLYDNRKKITGALENFFIDKFGYDKPQLLNETIPCECDYEIEEIYLEEYDDYNDSIYSKTYYETKTLQEDDLCKQSCLNADELDDYLKDKDGYAIHISNLDVYAEPKKIGNYVKGDWIEYSNGPTFFRPEAIEHVPKSMTFVWCKENGDQYLFIPVNPEQLCKILNKECTILIKKRVLKEML